MELHKTPNGFITWNDLDLMGQVAKCLNERDPSLNVIVEHTGGGIFCIELQLNCGGHFMNWGTADGEWGGEINTADGDILEAVTLPTPLKDDSKPEEAASEIFAAVKECKEKLSL